MSDAKFNAMHGCLINRSVKKTRPLWKMQIYTKNEIISASLAIRIAEQSAYVTDHVVPRLSVRMYVLW